MDAPSPTDTALLVHIEHSKPIDLQDFTTSLNSLARLYSSYVRENGGSEWMCKSRLYVRKVEDGCIDIYLCEMVAASIIPYIENVNTILDFASYLKSLVGYLCHGEGVKPNLTADKCNDIEGMFAINVHDQNGETSICATSIKDNTMRFENCTFNFTESNSAQNQVRQERSAIMEAVPTARKFDHQLMTIFQVRGEQDKDKGNKAVIAELSPRRLPLLFNSDELKHDILFSDANPMRKGYFVDGEILVANGKEVAYKITTLHDTIDLEG